MLTRTQLMVAVAELLGFAAVVMDLLVWSPK